MMIAKTINKAGLKRLNGLLCWILWGFCFFFCFSFSFLSGQESEIIASGEVTVQGVRLEINPTQQTVPINTETVVNTVFSVDNPDLLEGMVVKGTLRGPGFKEPITLTTLPNHAFAIPGFTTKGTYTLENIRLEREGKVLVTAEPDQAVIEAMDIIVTKVETRPLTLEEIREKGIVISQENFSVFNFSVGFMVNSQEVRYDFPIVYSGNNEVYIPGTGTGGGLGLGPTIKRGVREPVPIRFELPEIELPGTEIGQQESGPSVSGVVIFNNDIAFLNQFFSVMFIVSNHAPQGSALTLKDLTAKITFPEGLREAETNPPHIMGAPIPVRCPGPDGQIGTADDLDIIMATFSGMAEFLAEGLKEGNHIVNIDFAGTLSGLPCGDTPVSGTAAGAVIVRNPEFGITFAHPSVIRKGEKYDIYVTMTNTSPVTANLVSLTMPANRLVGTSLLSDETVSFETIAPGESVTAQFHMQSHETGRIRASVFEADGNVSGKFVLTAGVGEEGIPLSPDTLVLPDWAYSLPDEMINASLMLLGEAYSIATTPPGGLPENLPYISTAVVKERAVEFAEAGQRYTYGDTLLKTVEALTLDWLGNRTQDINFDILRRLTSKGLKFAQQQALIFNEALNGQTPAQFQYSFAETCSYQSPFISAVLSFAGGSRTADLRITDFYQNRLSNEAGVANLSRDIPYGELYLMEDPVQSPVDFALIGHLEENGYKIEIPGKASGTFDLALIVPDSSGGFRQVVFAGVSCEPGSIASITINAADTAFTLSTDINGDGQEDAQVAGNVTVVQAPPLQLLSATQECSADSAGHATALFFNRPVEPETAKDKNNYYVEGKTIYAGFRQPSGRVVLIGTNNPISPFVESRVRVENLKDLSGGLLTPSPVEMPITATIKTPGGIVYGQVLSAEGQPIANAKIQLTEIDGSRRTLSFDISDSSGNYQFDFVRILHNPFSIEVLDPNSGKVERVTSRLLSNGQRLQVTILMRGRGNVKGKVTDTGGNPVVNATVGARAQSTATPGAGAWENFGAVTDEQGEYLITGVPIGRVSLSAGKGNKFGTASTSITAPGQTQTADIVIAEGKTAAVTGRVLYSDGVTPVAETYVNLYGENNFASGAQTDELGYFQFPIVPVGTFNCEAYNLSTGAIGGRVSGELVEDQTFNATIILRGTGRVYGKVVGHDGTPQQGVLVYMTGTSFYMDTDGNGEFDSPEVPVGTYHINAYSRTTYATASASVKLLTEGQEAYAVLVFPNTLPGGITGTVYDVDGTTPLSNISVYAADGNFIARASAISNASGTFQLDNLSPGNYIIFVVRGNKGGTAKAAVQSPGHVASCDVQFRGEGKVNINVFASDGQTGVMADVNFHRTVFVVEEGSRIGFYGYDEQYTTDENGHLEIDHVYMGGFSVSAKNEFYPRGASYYGNITGPGQEVNVDLVMRPTGKVKLHVVNWDNQTPVAGAALAFQSGALKYKGIYTDENGDFEFTLVPPGSFQVTAEDTITGLKGIRYGTMGEDGDLIEVTLRLLGQGQVNGVVKNQSGALIANANVTVKNMGYPHDKFETTTDDTGHFVVSGLWEGQFSVSAYDPLSHTGGLAQGEITGHNAQANVEVVTDPIGTVIGRVLSPDELSEVIDVQVVLYHSKFNYAAVGYFYVSQQGGYTFENIPAGQFYLEAIHPSSGRKGKLYSRLDSEGEIKEVNVSLEGRGTVTGTFFDGSRVNPVPNASIKITSKGKYPFTQVSSTNADGHFTFEQVGEGEFDLEATDPSNGLMGTASGLVAYDEQTVEINVIAQGWGSVQGVVYQADGNIDTSAAHVVLKQGFKTYNAYADATSGEYRIDFVPTGSFTATAYQQNGRDYGTAAGKVEFHGQEVVVDITFNGLGIVTGRVLDGGGNPQGGIPVTLKSGTESFTVSSGSESATLGVFRFEDIRMGPFSLEAKEPGTNLSGAGNGELTTNGQVVTIDLTLESAGTVRGRILNTDGSTPSENAYIKLKGSNFTQYFNTPSSGEFEFNAVRLGSFTVEVQGLNNSGKARVYGQLDSHGQEKDFGDLVLDDVIPQVTGFSPADGSGLVPLSSTAAVTFSEAMAASSITTSTVKLTSPAGKVAGSVALSQDLHSVVFTPSAPLSSFTLYTLVVEAAVEDAAGNPLATPVSASFTTSDIQPPQVTAINPANNSLGVPVETVITVTFNEPVDPGNFNSQNLVVTKGGVAIGGSLHFNEGNMSVVFTPASLATDSVYTVTVQGARDFVGNVQTVPFNSVFSTIDTVAPTVQLFPPAQGTTVIEGSSVQVTADTGSSPDVTVVHFFLNGELKKSDTTAPYKYTFTAPLISQVGNSCLVEALAEDGAGNQSNKANLTFTLQADTPPQVTLTGPSEPTVFPGGTISCSVSAADDLSLARVTLTALGGTLNYEDTRTWTDIKTAFARDYSIEVPVDILPGTAIVLHAEAEDTRGNVTGAADISILVPQDEEDPVVQITSPSEGARFKHNETVTIAADASDDVGLKEVRIYLDEQLLATHTQEPYTADYTVPPLEQEQPAVVKVEAEDLSGKVSAAAVNIVLEQLVDLTAPQVKIVTPSDGTLVYAGENLQIKVEVSDDEGVDRVEFFVDEQLIRTLTQAPYQVDYTVPADAVTGSSITLKAVATDVDNKTGTDQSVLEVVTGTFLPAGTLIAAGDPGYDNQTIIINDGIVTINGSHSFLNVLVKETGQLTHQGSDTNDEYRLALTVSGKVVVGPAAGIDTSSKGYMGARQTVNGFTNASDYGLTLGNQPGSYYNSGGSYGGYGGQYSTNAVTDVYGSPYDPANPGSGGGGYSGNPGGNGGGVIRIRAANLILDGQLLANGNTAANYAGGGAGGSIYLNLTTLTGTGQIQANGGSSRYRSGGGGGRVAIFYQAAAFDLNTITAWGGKSNLAGASPIYNGTAGTLYLEKYGQTGQLLVKNDPDIENSKGTPLKTTAPGTITALEPGKLTDANADFIPGSLAGMLLQPNSENPKTFIITSNTATEILVEYQPGDDLLQYAQVGDRYQVKHRGEVLVESSLAHINGNAVVSNLVLDNATLVVDGTLEADQLTLQSGSRITHSPTIVGTTYSLFIKAGELDVGDGCSIDVDGSGYPGAFEKTKGNQTGTTGVTYPNTLEKGSERYCGGSYGSYAGRRYISSSYEVNGPYGWVTDPNVPGSGGGGESTSFPGTSGGGVIGLQVGTLILNGTITASGISVSGWGGTGSGGSIRIDTNTISGVGSIRADGGNTIGECGAGSGGRIALYYENAAEYDLNNITAYGGISGTGSDTRRNGSAGTIYLNKTDEPQLPAQLIIANRGVEAYQPLVFPVMAPAQITSVSGDVLENTSADYMPGSLMGMTLIPNINNPEDTYLITANTATTITVDRAISGAQAGDTYKGAVVFAGDLQIINTVSQMSQDVELGGLSLTDNSVLYHPECTTTSESFLAITAAGKVFIDSSSRIDVSERGYLGGYQGDNNSQFGKTFNNADGSFNHSGGSHGGQAGQWGTNAVDNTYGSLYEPLYPGGGGGGYNASNPGGNGGGVIRINADLLELNGSLISNGGTTGNYAGSGAGGSIYLEVKTLKGTGDISANGGNSVGHCGGGGGRVAICYENAAEFNFANIHAYGGIRENLDQSLNHGGAGTIYLMDTNNNRTELMVDNNNVSTESETRLYSTPLPAVGQGIYTMLEANRLEDAYAAWIPGAFSGIKLNPNPLETTVFKIISNTGTEIFTDAAEGNMTETPQTGGQYIGEHHLFNLTVKGSARVFTTDRIQVSGTLTVAPGSVLKAENHQ